MSTTKTFSFKPFVKFAILIAIILALFNVGGKVINSYNQSVELESSFEVKKKERLASINRITVIVRQKLQVAKINDSSYTKNLMAIAVSRTSNANWQWLQENNANSNYGEVSKFYAEVLLSIQSERDILFSIEKELQSIDYQYTMLHRKFPTSIYLFWMPRKLDYMPISTSYNAEVNRTNIDSVTSL